MWRPSDLPPDLFTDLADDSVAGSVSSFESTTNTVTVRASCTRRCLLVVTDLFYPGWQARVGQRKLAIVPANGIFRAVVLEAGDHELHMRYAPASFRAGMAISGGTFLLILGCLVAARRERIRSTRAQRV